MIFYHLGYILQKLGSLVNCLQPLIKRLEPWLTKRQFKEEHSIADRILHVLSNTFVVVPLNAKPKAEEPTKDEFHVCFEDEKEEPKGKEVSVLLILTGVELAAQIIVGNFLEFWSIHNSFCCKVEDWGIWLFFPLLFWALGCLFMFLFYRFFHTWSGSLPKKLNNFHFVPLIKTLVAIPSIYYRSKFQRQNIK